MFRSPFGAFAFEWSSARIKGSHALRIPELDALRGIGALTILACHLWPSPFFFAWTRVDLFFVLSGYLITSIIIEHDCNLRFLLCFWIRRVLRIWPAYYLLILILCVRAILERRPLELAGLVSHLSFTQNCPYYWSPHVPRFELAAIQTWSLAVEEQFYVLWPLIIASAGRVRIVLTAVWLILTCVATRLHGLYPIVALGRADGLAFGAILAVIFRDNAWVRRKSKPLDCMLISLGLASVVFISGPASALEDPIPGIAGYGPFSLLAINALYFSIVGLVILHTKHPALALLRSCVLVYLGRISYGIFLYHLLVIEVVERCVMPGSLSAHATSLFLSLFVAAMSWEFLERPIGNLKDRFPYRSQFRTSSP